MEWEQEYLLFLVLGLLVLADGCRSIRFRLQDLHREQRLPSPLAGVLEALRVVRREA